VLEGQPIEIVGWQLYLAFAGLLLLALAFPEVSGAGLDPDSIGSTPDLALPIVAVATAGALAGLFGRLGYDVAVALGGGAVLTLTAFFAAETRKVMVLSDYAAGQGVSLGLGAGLVIILIAAVVGLAAVVPGLRAATSSESAPVHPLVGVAGLVGVVLYVIGLAQSSVDDANPAPWEDDGWVDAFGVLLLAVIAGAALLAALRRTGPACAFLGGTMVFLVGIWLVDLDDTSTSLTAEKRAESPAITIGLLLVIGVAVVGSLTATQLRSSPAGPVRRRVGLGAGSA